MTFTPKYTRKNAPYGKGDSPRQGQDIEKYHKGWDRIFGTPPQPVQATDADPDQISLFDSD